MLVFGNTPEKRIAREADKVASLKEDLDAISWGRVLDIGKLLQAGAAGNAADLGAELVSIAQSNLSLSLRLGFDPVPPEGRVMASGMEIVEGGLAEAALDDRAARAKGAGAVAASGAAVGAVAPGEPEVADRAPVSGEGAAPVLDLSGLDVAVAGKAPDAEAPDVRASDVEASEAGAFVGGDALSSLSFEDLIRVTEYPLSGAKGRDDEPREGGGEPVEASFDPQEPPERIVCGSTTELPIDLPRIPRFDEVSTPAAEPERAAEPVPEPEVSQDQEREQASEPERQPLAAAEPQPMPESERAAEPEPAPKPESGQERETEQEPAQDSRPAPAPEPAPAPDPQPEPAPHSQPAPEPASADRAEGASLPEREPSAERESGDVLDDGRFGGNLARRRFARFRNLYESRDGALCVFEDEHGHLVAVDSSKLA